MGSTFYGETSVLEANLKGLKTVSELVFLNAFCRSVRLKPPLPIDIFCLSGFITLDLRGAKWFVAILSRTLILVFKLPSNLMSSDFFSWSLLHLSNNSVSSWASLVSSGFWDYSSSCRTYSWKIDRLGPINTSSHFLSFYLRSTSRLSIRWLA